MLLSTANLCTLENSTIQKLSVIIIILFCVLLATIANPQEGEICSCLGALQRIVHYMLNFVHMFLTSEGHHLTGNYSNLNKRVQET